MLDNKIPDETHEENGIKSLQSSSESNAYSPNPLRVLKDYWKKHKEAIGSHSWVIRITRDAKTRAEKTIEPKAIEKEIAVRKSIVEQDTAPEITKTEYKIKEGKQNIRQSRFSINSADNLLPNVPFMRDFIGKHYTSLVESANEFRLDAIKAMGIENESLDDNKSLLEGQQTRQKKRIDAVPFEVETGAKTSLEKAKSDYNYAVNARDEETKKIRLEGTIHFGQEIGDLFTEKTLQISSYFRHLANGGRGAIAEIKRRFNAWEAIKDSISQGYEQETDADSDLEALYTRRKDVAKKAAPSAKFDT